jgi:hypothetical protein
MMKMKMMVVRSLEREDAEGLYLARCRVVALSAAS